MDHLSSIHSEIFKPLILLRRLRCKMSSYMLLTSASQVLCEVGRHFAANFSSVFFDWSIRWNLAGISSSPRPSSPFQRYHSQLHSSVFRRCFSMFFAARSEENLEITDRFGGFFRFGPWIVIKCTLLESCPQGLCFGGKLWCSSDLESYSFLFVNLPWRHKESFISVRFTRHWWWPSTQFIERVRAMIQGWSGEVCFSDAPRWTRAQVCIATLFGSACLYNNISERFWEHIRALRYLQVKFWFKLLCMIIDRGYIYVSYKEHDRQDRYQQNLL